MRIDKNVSANEKAQSGVAKAFCTLIKCATGLTALLVVAGTVICYVPQTCETETAHTIKHVVVEIAEPEVVEETEEVEEAEEVEETEEVEEVEIAEDLDVEETAPVISTSTQEKQETVKQTPVKQEAVKQTPAKQEVVKQEKKVSVQTPVKQEPKTETPAPVQETATATTTPHYVQRSDGSIIDITGSVEHKALTRAESEKQQKAQESAWSQGEGGTDNKTVGQVE